jgi:hypothetical protein
MNVTKSMYQYSGGVFAPTPQECAQTSMGTHAMEVVGFGETEQGLPYWILKNSWGSGYGVNGGYLLMTRLERIFPFRFLMFFYSLQRRECVRIGPRSSYCFDHQTLNNIQKLVSCQFDHFNKPLFFATRQFS